MTTYVIHRDDYEGQFAAFVTYLAMREKNQLDSTQFISLNYGDKFPLELDQLSKDDSVYILSYLMEREALDKIDAVVGELFFINHMKSALEKLHDAEYTLINTNQSSALTTWGHFFLNKRPPVLALLISDRKMAKNKHIETGQLAAWLNYAQYGQDWEKWEELMNDRESYDAALKYGRMLMRYEQRMVEAFIETPGAVLVQNGDLLKDHSSKTIKYAIYNNRTPFVTMTAQAIMKRYDIDYTIDWCVDMGKDVVVFELRSRDPAKFSVQAYAEKHHGGGQPEAAGFTMHIVDGLQLVKNLGL